MKPFNNTRAAREGWGLFNRDVLGRAEIQRVDGDAKFVSDAAAVAYVRRQAEAGSAYHQRALDTHLANLPAKSMREVRKRIARLSDKQKSDLIEDVVRVLYCNDEEFDPEVEWTSETVEWVAASVNDYLKVKV
jgi:hypothetical protein